MDYFNDIESYLKYNPNVIFKKLVVVREGQTGEIQKVSLGEKTENREKYSFYGSLLPLDLEYIPKKI